MVQRHKRSSGVSNRLVNVGQWIRQICFSSIVTKRRWSGAHLHVTNFIFHYLRYQSSQTSSTCLFNPRTKHPYRLRSICRCVLTSPWRSWHVWHLLSHIRLIRRSVTRTILQSIITARRLKWLDYAMYTDIGNRDPLCCARQSLNNRSRGHSTRLNYVNIK
jgi:hypothetical protein